jgi:hypothetical protein
LYFGENCVKIDAVYRPQSFSKNQMGKSHLY